MKKISFVIVDDAVFMRTIIKKMIEQVDGYTVVGKDKRARSLGGKKYQPDIMTLYRNAGNGHSSQKYKASPKRALLWYRQWGSSQWY